MHRMCPSDLINLINAFPFADFSKKRETCIFYIHVYQQEIFFITFAGEFLYILVHYHHL